MKGESLCSTLFYNFGARLFYLTPTFFIEPQKSGKADGFPAFLCRLFVIRNADKLGFIELLETTNVGRGLINLCMIAPGNHGYANSLRAHRPADLYRNQQSYARRQKLPRCHPERSVAESKDLVGKGEILRLAFGSLRMTHLFALAGGAQDPTLQWASGYSPINPNLQICVFIAFKNKMRIILIFLLTNKNPCGTIHL